MEVSRLKSAVSVLLTCVLSGVFCQAQAATLQVSPVKVDFAAGQNAAGLELNNPGDTPVYAQVRVFSWSQTADGDVLGPSEEVVASPPIIQLAGHGRQLIRLIKVKALNDNVEQSYRLLIDEIPPPGTDQHSGVAIRMRYSIPVFIAAKTAATTQLNWQVVRQDGQWWLRVDNRGQRHSQVGALTVQDAAGSVVQVSNGLLGYALAGHLRQWPLHNVGTARLEGPLLIKVNLDGRPSTFKVTGEG